MVITMAAYHSRGESMKCDKCNAECHRDDVDIGVGVIYGPYGCPECGWSQDPEYDCSEGRSIIHESGWTKNQYGGLNPPFPPEVENND